MAPAGACINTIVTANFSKAMNPATINANTFTLMGPTGTVVPGVVTYSSNSRTAILTPSGSLAPNTLYTATISTGARDVFGNALASSLVWSFATGVTTCSGIGTPAVLAAFRATAAPRP